jgi:hypothetical protein
VELVAVARGSNVDRSGSADTGCLLSAKGIQWLENHTMDHCLFGEARSVQRGYALWDGIGDN